MDLVKLGRKGQLSIPRAVLNRVGITNGMYMLVDTMPDGAIVLRQAAVYPIEMYSDERVQEFLEADIMPTTMKRKVADALNANR